MYIGPLEWKHGPVDPGDAAGFEETMTSVRNGMNADMKEEIHTLEKKIEKKIDTTNQNM